MTITPSLYRDMRIPKPPSAPFLEFVAAVDAQMAAERAAWQLLGMTSATPRGLTLVWSSLGRCRRRPRVPWLLG